VRAGVAGEASEYEWSSARMRPVGAARPEGLEQVLDGNGWRVLLDRGCEEASAIREAMYGGRPLGSRKSVAGLEEHAGRRLERGAPGRPRKEIAVTAAGMGSSPPCPRFPPRFPGSPPIIAVIVSVLTFRFGGRNDP
jgi:hypothetical protein